MALTVKGGSQEVGPQGWAPWGWAPGCEPKGVCTVLLDTVLAMVATEMENAPMSFNTTTMSIIPRHCWTMSFSLKMWLFDWLRGYIGEVVMCP